MLAICGDTRCMCVGGWGHEYMEVLVLVGQGADRHMLAVSGQNV